MHNLSITIFCLAVLREFTCSLNVCVFNEHAVITVSMYMLRSIHFHLGYQLYILNAYNEM